MNGNHDGALPIRDGVLRIPEGTVSLPAESFFHRSDLTDVYIPASLRDIGRGSFGLCSSFAAFHVDGANEVYASYDGALYDRALRRLILCPEGKTDISFPDTLREIGDWAMADSRVTEAVLPDGLETIGQNAFFRPHRMKRISLPRSLRELPEDAFQYQYDLERIDIPDTVTCIRKSMFKYTQWLTSHRGTGWAVAGAGILLACFLDDAHVTLPEGIRVIGEGAFEDCEHLTHLTLSDSLESVDAGAFYGCRKLKTVTAFGIDLILNPESFCYSVVRRAVRDGVYRPREEENDDDLIREDNLLLAQTAAHMLLDHGQPEADAWLRENADTALGFYMDRDDYETVRRLLDARILTRKHLLSCLEHVLTHTAQGGDMQIQMLLMAYRQTHYPDVNPMGDMDL